MNRLSSILILFALFISPIQYVSCIHSMRLVYYGRLSSISLILRQPVASSSIMSSNIHHPARDRSFYAKLPKNYHSFIARERLKSELSMFSGCREAFPVQSNLHCYTTTSLVCNKQFHVIRYKPMKCHSLRKICENRHMKMSENDERNTIDLDYDYRFRNVNKLYQMNDIDYPDIDNNKISTNQASTPANDVSRGTDSLRKAHVCVVGLGGVGSWAAEALARSGVGRFTIVDLDDICISNINRQSHALTSTVGRFKGEVLRDRILDINPYANITMELTFVSKQNVFELINRKFDYVVEAVDGVSDKVAIINACVETKTPVITAGGAAGLTDPTLLTIR